MNFEFREKSLSSGNCCDNVKIQKDRDNKVNAGYIPAPPAFADFTQKGEAGFCEQMCCLDSDGSKVENPPLCHLIAVF